MIEENIIEWIELGDSIQKMDLYNKKSLLFFFKINYLFLQYSNYSEFYYLLIIFLYFAQIWELNIIKAKIEGDGILDILKYLEKVFLFGEIITDNITFIIFYVLSLFIYALSTVLGVINVRLFDRKRKSKFLININSYLNLLIVYYLNGPFFQIVFSSLLYYEKDQKYPKLCPLNNATDILKLIIFIIFGLFLLLELTTTPLYLNDMGNLNNYNINSRIAGNFTLIIIISKLIYFILHFLLKFIIHTEKDILIYGYLLIFVFINLFISFYAYRDVLYYNYLIDVSFHFGWYYTSWFSICIFFKKLIGIKDITLFIVFGIIIISIGFYFAIKYRSFQLITEFNIFEANNNRDIEIYNLLLLNLYKNDDHESKILVAGVIKRLEEYLNGYPEYNEQYHKFITDKHLKKKFTNNIELKVLSLIAVIYSYNIEKSKDSPFIAMNLCYFFINKCKNVPHAIWLCSRIKVNTHIQSFFKYVLVEQIKDYLIEKLKKNRNRLTIRHVQISTVILYYQYVDLFKIKIYDATYSQIEYFDILRNNITTAKTTENFLKIGEDILTLRQDIINLWEKIISLNPFSTESEKDYMIYLETILKDDVLMKTEEKRFNTLKAEKLPERNNPYYSLFIQEISSVLLIDGYSFSGKVLYATPNFPSLFMFSGKEILNTSIDDLMPDVVQSFHRYLIEDGIRSSNLGHIFKNQKDVLLKGKNGLIFNIYLFNKPCPNLTFGLIFFSYIQKFQEQNFIIILDSNLIINGFTGMNQIGSNFTLNNIYGLSFNINGHHIGIIIPEILLQLNYDVNSNTFSLTKNNIDLKGNLYQINNFKDYDSKINKILEILKERKISEQNNENKNNSFEEYEEFIKELNSQKFKTYSIFFRIELHSFIGGKYKYYRIYIVNDLLSGKESSLSIDSYINSNISDENNLKDNNKKMKLKDLNEDNKKTMIGNELHNQILGTKLIRLKTELNRKSNVLNKEEADKINKINNKKINLIESSNDNNNKSKNINFSKPSNPSSILTQSSAESSEFNKLKNEIINKNDSFYVKLMRYFSYGFLIINILLIIYDYYCSQRTINLTVEYLWENLFFTHTKIGAACVYNTVFNLKLIKSNIIKDEECIDIKCKIIYSNLLQKCLKDIRNQKINISYFHSDFQKIFAKKLKAELCIYNRTEYNILDLDIDNFLNLLIAQGMKIIANLTNYFDNSIDAVDLQIIDIYLKNVLKNSIKYFESNYTGFRGKEKEENSNEVADVSFLRFSISIGFIVILSCIFTFYIYKINSMELYFLDRLINFTSTSFDEYLKQLEDLKKRFRDDSNEEDDKNLDEFDLKGDEIDGKNENNSKEEDKNQNVNTNNKNSKKKKSKQNKIQQQKLKKKKIMSHYFYILNLFFALKIAIILLITALYFIITIVLTIRMKNNYKEFDSVLEQINEVYFDSFKIFLMFKKELEEFYNSENKENVQLMKDSDIERPKLGNSLISISKNSKYSSQSLAELTDLYNNNACLLLSNNNATKEVCENLFSSILTKGMEQAIVQMSIIITSCVDEINSLKENKTLEQIYKRDGNYFSYEIFVGEFMLESFLKTQNIFEVFRNDEKSYIFKIIRIFIFIFCVIFFICIISWIYFIYSYKNVINSFFNFIGILPGKFIADDEYLYKTILKLEKEFY